MKKLLFLLLLLPSLSFGEAVTAFYSDFIGEDTNGTRVDTIYTDYIDVRDCSRLWITFKIAGYSNDTVFTADSFFVGLQYSSDAANWYGHATGDSLQKILKGANDTTINIATGISRDSIFCADYVRVRVLHRNTLANQQALTANTYVKRITAWFNAIKEGD